LMRVLVTGADGFLGGAISARLERRHDAELIKATRASFDLLEADAMRRAIGQAAPDVVVHAAGRTRGGQACLEADNVGTTATLAAALTEISPDAGLILLGSAAQYGRSPDRSPWNENDRCEPLDAYGASKQASEQAAFAAHARV